MENLHSPTELDLALPDAVLIPACRKAVSDSLTPTLSLVNHGCERKLRDLASAMRVRVPDPDPATEQQAHDFSDHDLADASAEAKECLRAVALRVLGLACGKNETSMGEELQGWGVDLHGRLCLRQYPPMTDGKQMAPRLGAHIDNTLLTLLWADGPGLQVLDSDRAQAAGWTPQDILSFGLPTMMPVLGKENGSEKEPPPLTNEHWATVDLDWARDPLLLTIGASWLQAEVVQGVCPAQCAALHRVVLPADRSRYSLPFLCDFVQQMSTEAPGG